MSSSILTMRRCGGQQALRSIRRAALSPPLLLRSRLPHHCSMLPPSTVTSDWIRAFSSSSPPSSRPPRAASPSPELLNFVDRARQFGSASLLGRFIPGGGFDTLLSHMTVDELDPAGVVSCTLPLSDPCLAGQPPSSPDPPHPAYSFSNSYQRLHGGLYLLLVDVVGTLSLLAKDSSRAGVSVDIGCQFLLSCELSDSLRCEGRVLKLGRRLGFTEVRMYRVSDGQLAAVGKHIKAM